MSGEGFGEGVYGGVMGHPQKDAACYLFAVRHLIKIFWSVSQSKHLTQNVCVYSFQGDEDDFIKPFLWQKSWTVLQQPVLSLMSLFTLCMRLNVCQWIF